jgi:hypothetical protein
VQDGWPEDDFERLKAEGVQQKFAFGNIDEAELAQKRHPRRVACLEGFSLHADTWVHQNDRQGLERLCRYAARGPIASSRLSRLADGRYRYESKKGKALTLTAAQLVKRLIALIPPPKLHLSSFHGIFAPNSKLRPKVTAAPVAEERRTLTPARQKKEAGDQAMPKRPRLDWATLQKRTFGNDVWVCPCGGNAKSCPW